MGGGLMQLVAYGAQDVYLTGNPQITFFKVVYRRHTNFAMECIEQTLTGNPDFGRRSQVTIIRNGDLATRCYLKVILNAVLPNHDFAGKMAWVRALGHALIKDVEVEIGGSQIDKHYGTWLDLWYSLTHTEEQIRGYRKLIGDVEELTKLEPVGQNGYLKDEYTMYIPLQFWFNRNSGLALPLIALQYHEVRLNFEFAEASTLAVWTPGANCVAFSPRQLSMKDASLLVDYVYLDSEERRRFAQVGHEYLIEQVQFTGEESILTSTSGSTTGKYKLGFNHPCKELVWAVKGGNFTQGKTFLTYTHLDDWSGALETAAVNLALGMFYVGMEPPSDSGYVQVTSASTDYDNGSAKTSSSSSTGDIDHEVNVELIGDVMSGGPWIWVRQDVFFVDGYNLGDKIDSVVLTITAIDSATWIISAVKVLAHTLSIRDISIPLENGWQDHRVYYASDGTVVTCNPFDVKVYQFNNYGVLLDGTGNPCEFALIQLNGHDRFDRREGAYFNYVQPYQHHTHTPVDGVNVYSFALHPEQHQPSGTANLSRIDNTQLNIWFRDPSMVDQPKKAPALNFFTNDTLLYVWAFSYNVLRIMSGMGGLAYSN